MCCQMLLRSKYVHGFSSNVHLFLLQRPRCSQSSSPGGTGQLPKPPQPLCHGLRGQGERQGTGQR